MNTQIEEEFVLHHWYYDETEWEKHYRSAISDITGSYPVETGEVMISESALKKLGIENPEIGMEVRLDDTYTLTGWFTQYTSDEKIFHSGECCQQQGLTIVADGTLAVTARNGDYKALEEAVAQIELREDQEWDFFYVQETGNMNGGAVMLMVMVSLFIVLSGYLFIYNVMYISVTKDIQFYGLLKTIGTSPKQIRQIVRGQAYVFALTGIPAGIAAGMLVSFGVVPYALGLMDGLSAMPGDVSVHPAVFLGTILFSMLAIVLSCRKPADMAARVSPIEAVRYTGIEKTDKKKERNSVSGGKISRMAVHNVFRYKKRAVLVFSSLFLGTITILCVNSILDSMKIENYIEQYFASDITISNPFPEDEDAVSQQTFERIADIDGVKDVQVYWCAELALKYDQELFGEFLDADLGLAGESGEGDDLRQRYAEGTEEYVGKVVSMSPDALANYIKNSGQYVDEVKFEAGETAIIGLADSLSNPETLAGGKIVIYDEGGAAVEMEVAGVAGAEDVSYLGTWKVPGTPDLIFVSESALTQMTDKAAIVEMQLSADESRLEEVDRKIGRLLEHASEYVTISSRVDMETGFKSSMQTLRILGNGISLILILVGMLNFVNVMLTGVYSRRRELAVMESIGMTKKQIRRMLIMEGGYYAVISALLILTVGSGVLALTGRWVPSLADYATFEYPAALTAVLIVVIFAICLSVPGIVYHLTIKESVTERIRAAE